MHISFIILFLITAQKHNDIEIVSSAELSEYHTQYVDLCQWNPKQDIFVTASTDKKSYLWNCRSYDNGDPKSVNVTSIEFSGGQKTVSCMSWSDNGKFLILGN